MFEYSCSAMHLTNWIFSQVSDQPGAVFPKRKGWSFFMRTFYPANSDQSVLMVMVANRNECVVFCPVDKTVDNLQVRGALKPAIVNSLRSSFKQASYQQVLITSEKQQDRLSKLLLEKQLKAPLLVLSSEQIQFSCGNFENPRLEFRLSQLDYDPDFIPGFLHDNRLQSVENIQKSLYYQQFFHILNRLWLQGEKQVPLRQVINQSVPCWRHFRRVDQKQMMEQTYSELQLVFGRFFEGLATIETYRKKPTSQPELLITLPDPPENKKAVSTWSRKQRMALEFLHESAKPLSIEELELFIN